jgi:hypothetical protein
MTREQKMRMTIATLLAAALPWREAPPTVGEIVQIANTIPDEGLTKAEQFVALYETILREQTNRRNP